MRFMIATLISEAGNSAERLKTKIITVADESDKSPDPKKAVAATTSIVRNKTPLIKRKLG